MPIGTSKQINPTTGKPYTAAELAAQNGTGNGGTGQGMEALGGWAGQQGYNPSELAQTVYQNPFAILPDVFKGINVAGPGYQALRDIGGDPLALYNIMTGGNKAISEKTGLGDFTNWLRNMYASYGTTGGKAFSARDLLGQLFGQGEKSQSSLANIIRGAGQGGQAQVLSNLVREIAGSSMNPLAGAGYNAAMQRGADQYQNALINTSADQGANDMMITTWLKQNVPGLLSGI